MNKRYPHLAWTFQDGMFRAELDKYRLAVKHERKGHWSYQLFMITVKGKLMPLIVGGPEGRCKKEAQSLVMDAWAKHSGN